MKIRSLAVASLFALSAVSALATTITENFSVTPLQSGWKTFGNSNLFAWNSANQNVEVTWDSTNANSYLALPLGTVLTRDDAFSLSFDLQLHDAEVFNYGQELAIGLFNWNQATNPAFSRGGGAAPNVFEFDYFLDTGYGESIAGSLIDTSGDYDHTAFIYEDYRPLVPGVTYQIVLTHSAGTASLTGQVLTNGVVFCTLSKSFPPNLPLGDFRLDTLSISSYADDGWGDSILAHGAVDNFTVTLPPPPVQDFIGNFDPSGNWKGTFTSRTNWIYALERSTNLVSWTDVINNSPGVDGLKTLTDTAPAETKAFYRIRAERP